MVGDGRMPRPKRIDGRIVWDRIKLDQAFDSLDDEAGTKERMGQFVMQVRLRDNTVSASIDFSSRMSTGTAMCEFISGAKGSKRSDSGELPGTERLTWNISVPSAAN